MALVELTGIGKTVRAPDGASHIRILHDVCLEIDPGETLAIQGPSGSGKSTLLSIIGLLDTATSGSIHLKGVDVASQKKRQLDRWRAETFGFVFQRFCLLHHLSAQENVEMALANLRPRQSDHRRVAHEALEQVGLGERHGFRPRHLSGGEQQRVALARALVTGAPILLADEPTGSLDQATGSAVMRQIVDTARKQGRALVVVTHDNEIAETFQRCWKLEGGLLSEVKAS